MSVSRIITAAELREAKRGDVRPAVLTELHGHGPVIDNTTSQQEGRITDQARGLLLNALGQGEAQPMAPTDFSPRPAGSLSLDNTPRPYQPEAFGPGPSVESAYGKASVSRFDPLDFSPDAAVKASMDFPAPEAAMVEPAIYSEDINTAGDSAPAPSPDGDADADADSLPELPTASGLEAMHEQAREEGHREGYEQGLEQGREDGHKQGYEAGLEQALSEQAETSELCRNLLSELHQRVNEQDQSIENELMDLAISIASRVLRSELRSHPEHVLGAVRAGLAQLPSQQTRARIYLHPEDLATIGDQLKPDDPDHRWTLLEDPTLSRGSHRLEAGDATLSVDIEQRLDDAIDAALSGGPDGDEHLNSEPLATETA
ncbi:MAG: flagellar assembly protein FliH [Gammaproteobacteria bacterium]